MKNVYYNFIFSDEQLNFLRSKKYKIDRMECFNKLLPLVAIEPRTVQITKAKSIILQAGQFLISVKQLEKLWDIDRKTVPGLLAKMQDTGIVTSISVDDVTVRILHPIVSWYVDGRTFSNPYRTVLPSEKSVEVLGVDEVTSDVHKTETSSNDSTADDDHKEHQISSVSSEGDSETTGVKVTLYSPESDSSQKGDSESCVNQDSGSKDKEISHSQSSQYCEPSLFPEMSDVGVNVSAARSEQVPNSQPSTPNPPSNSQQHHSSGSYSQNNGYNNRLHPGGQGYFHGKTHGNLRDHHQQGNR